MKKEDLQEKHYLLESGIVVRNNFYGDIQGITQTFANRRTFSPVDISFYVKSDYKTIKYFNKMYYGK